jgi:hypothetical protein
MTSQVSATKAVVSTGILTNNHTPLNVVLYNEDGSRAGTVKTAAAQADSVAATVGALVTDFNALLAKLRTAGVIAP